MMSFVVKMAMEHIEWADSAGYKSVMGEVKVIMARIHPYYYSDGDNHMIAEGYYD
jgi:chitinase